MTYLDVSGPSDMLLQLHTGTALANKFTKVLEDFGMADKVSTFLFNKDEHLPLEDFEHDLQQRIRKQCYDGRTRVHVSTFQGTNHQSMGYPTRGEFSGKVFNKTVQRTAQDRE